MAGLTDKPANVVPFDSMKTIACPYCGGERQIPLAPVEHLIVTMMSDGKINVHGCIHMPEVIARMQAAITIETIRECVKLGTTPTMTKE